ncbi:hypothetical protein OIU84_000535 [Salix udensis]|uniref:Uncharacterized protein n=1 Tax=Salix udensis TaxID=889485 RepID=A0AAD6L647_9ROSI|nr:hypothetical protein OIU84_000535 [Salix udensis]
MASHGNLNISTSPESGNGEGSRSCGVRLTERPMPVLADDTSRVIPVQASSVKVFCCFDDEKIKVYATQKCPRLLFLPSLSSPLDQYI